MPIVTTSGWYTSSGASAALEVYAGYMPALQGRTALALRRGAMEEEVEEALR